MYDGCDILQTQQGGTLAANYLNGLGVDEHLSANPNGGALTTYLPDRLGSTMALATGSPATVQISYAYAVNGAMTQMGAASTNPFTFTGREGDSTGLIAMRNRYYKPNWGRFISEDPIDITGGVNLYEYAGNNPATFSDPTGNFFFLAAFAAGAIESSAVAALGDGILMGAACYASGSCGSPVPAISPSVGTATPSGMKNNPANIMASAPPLPDNLVGTPPNKSNSSRTNSGPLDPSNGGTGNTNIDFDKLTGGTGTPPPPDSTLPNGSLVGENGTTLRSSPAGPRIDIPSNGGKLRETIHY